MSDHYDRLETRPSASRETTLFRDLRHVLATAKPRVAALRSQLRGVDVAGLRNRAELARVPMVGAGAAVPDGVTGMRAGGMRQAFMVRAEGGVEGGADLLLVPEGHARDWWGMGRALFAAGLRRGTPVLNCFPYDLVPHGHMVASGAAAVGAPVVPAGAAGLAGKAEAVRRLRPGFFCGATGELKALLDHCAAHDIDARCLRGALVMGPLSAGLRHEFGLRGVAVRRAVALPAFGVVAYESEMPDAMILNEGLICEITDERSGGPAPPGQVGTLVLTRVNGDYPLLRHATGLSTALLSEPATCGRTNTRIRPPWLAIGVPDVVTPEAVGPDAFTIDGPRALAARLREVAARHPKLGRMRLDTRHRRDEGAPHLRVEHGGGDAPAAPMAETLRLVADLRGTFEIVAPGTLGEIGTLGEDEGADERRPS